MKATSSCGLCSFVIDRCCSGSEQARRCSGNGAAVFWERSGGVLGAGIGGVLGIGRAAGNTKVTVTGSGREDAWERDVHCPS